MIRYLFQRLAWGFLILLGVLLVTFLLFNWGAGDPAALMLGKNASARELENLRAELKLNRPLFWGHWRRSELYRSWDFHSGPGEWNTQEGSAWDARNGGGLQLFPGTEITLVRQWQPSPSDRFRFGVRYQGNLILAGKEPQHHSRAKWEWLEGPATTENVVLKAGPEGAVIRAFLARQYQQNPWDSQFVGTLRELVDWRRHPETGKWGFSFFNFGRTLLTGEPIREVLLNGLGPSLALMLPVFFIELVMALFMAMISAYWHDTWLDRMLVIVTVVLMSISYLVYILIGQYVFAYYLNWFPVWGFDSWRNLVLPVAVGVFSGLGGSVRFYRAVFLNEMYRDHIRTALAKGCGTWRILLRHVLPNALIPIITRVAVVLPFLYTGSLLLESFFGIPGLGFAGINALANADLQMLKALVVVGSLLFILVNILADLAYAVVDPRLRLR